jgi:hypothetical protein
MRCGTLHRGEENVGVRYWLLSTIESATSSVSSCFTTAGTGVDKNPCIALLLWCHPPLQTKHQITVRGRLLSRHSPEAFCLDAEAKHPCGTGGHDERCQQVNLPVKLARSLLRAAGCLPAAPGIARRRSSNTTAGGNRKRHHCTALCTTDEMSSPGSGRNDSSRPTVCCAMRYLKPSTSILTADCYSTVQHGCTVTPASTLCLWRSRVKSEDSVPPAMQNEQ